MVLGQHEGMNENAKSTKNNLKQAENSQTAKFVTICTTYREDCILASELTTLLQGCFQSMNIKLDAKLNDTEKNSVRLWVIRA